MRGAVLTTWQSDGYDGELAVLDTLDEMGGTHVAVLSTWYVADVDAPRIEPLARTPSTDGIRRAVAEARSRGLRVSLKPHVDRLDGGWRGEIVPEDMDQWFEDYGVFLLSHASLAEELDLPQLVIGTELVGVSGEEASWRALIDDVRQVYDGELVYAANWDEYPRITWWDAVDVVGVDAYFPLATTDRPTERSLRRSWRRITRTLGDFSDRVDRDLLIAEYGYQARDGTARTPWWTDGDADEEEQAACHGAALEAISTEPRIRGAMMWKVDSVADLDDFGVLGRQAQDVVARAWSRADANR